MNEHIELEQDKLRLNINSIDRIGFYPEGENTIVEFLTKRVNLISNPQYLKQWVSTNDRPLEHSDTSITLEDEWIEIDLSYLNHLFQGGPTSWYGRNKFETSTLIATDRGYNFPNDRDISLTYLTPTKGDDPDTTETTKPQNIPGYSSDESIIQGKFKGEVFMRVKVYVVPKGSQSLAQFYADVQEQYPEKVLDAEEIIKMNNAYSAKSFDGSVLLKRT